MTEYRAHFDARITFLNGGSLTAEDFRLDLPSGDESEAEVGRLLIGHLGLALVGDVTLSDLRIVAEPHRGSRGITPGTAPGQPEGEGRRLVDLSHTIRAGMVTYPGLPGPVIEPHLSRADSVAHYAAGTSFAIDTITMVGNTGTYLDSPFHRYAEGIDLAGLDLAVMADLPAEVLHVQDSSRRDVPAATFHDRDVRGAAVLIHTGWDRHFGTTQYGQDAPFLSAAGAQYLVEAGAALVGIDSVNIDDTSAAAGGSRPAHSALLAAGIPIVEHLTNLGAVPPRGARFTAVPPRVAGFGTFPVRAFARVR